MQLNRVFLEFLSDSRHLFSLAFELRSVSIVGTYVGLVLFELGLRLLQVSEKHVAEEPVGPDFLSFLLVSSVARNEFWLTIAFRRIRPTYLFSFIALLVVTLTQF